MSKPCALSAHGCWIRYDNIRYWDCLPFCMQWISGLWFFWSSRHSLFPAMFWGVLLGDDGWCPHIVDSTKSGVRVWVWWVGVYYYYHSVISAKWYQVLNLPACRKWQGQGLHAKHLTLYILHSFKSLPCELAYWNVKMCICTFWTTPSAPQLAAA